MNTIPLPGCTPTPLASYLKALGILRILSEQCPDASVQSYWSGNTFHLVTAYDEAAMIDFFLNRYTPSPIVAPWNGGSGFHPKDNSTALDEIVASTSIRFQPYREAIDSARAALTSMGLKEKPEKEAKEKLMLRCRNTFSETALAWLDCSYVLTDDGTKYPPLLGTGGNDGRLEFTNNYMQRLTEVFAMPMATPADFAEPMLKNALFGTPVKGLEDNPIGQFSPSAGGGANASTGFDAKSTVNPWDFILALEGAILFVTAAVKRLEGTAPGQLIYPFCVQPSGAGYGSSASKDEAEARCEIWMPLWSGIADINEIRALFNEGRAWVGRRPARNGVDFALAIASLGVDRGVAEFQRYGFHVRNGLAYFATPLQRLRVHRDPVTADLLSACDDWIQRFLSKARPETAPGSIRRAANRLEKAIFARTASAQNNNPDTAQELLIALGECERALAGSEKFRKESFLHPLPRLPRGWLTASDNGCSTEFRLAAALCSLDHTFGKEFFPLRRHFEPVKFGAGESTYASWDDGMRNEIVWHEGDIVTVLHAIMKRRLLLAKANGATSWPEYATVTAWPSDIAAFIEGNIDWTRLGQLIWGLSLVNFSRRGSTELFQPIRPADDSEPPAFYSQLKLCFSHLPDERKVPLESVIFELAARGDGERASKQALRRLQGSHIPIIPVPISLQGDVVQRSAAALLFPLWTQQLESISESIAPDLFKKHLTNHL